MSGFTSQVKTVTLMAVLTILFMLIGNAISGSGGMTIALILAIVMNGAGYWFSDKIAIRMTRSYPVTQAEQPMLYDIVGRLSHKAGLPMPKLYITPSSQPNAFATGRNYEHSAVAVTEGILYLLNREELEGVLAHELAHIKNRDVLIGSLAAMMAGAIMQIADLARWAMIFGRSDDEDGGSIVSELFLIILAPIAAILVQMSISRSREYLADATGAQIAGNSYGLSQALLKLEQGSRMGAMHANPATSHMFIVNPFKGKSILSLFSTHPPIDERVKRLRAMNR